ncbi:hypothetical protein PVAG01_05874 [Phlyctema vagabunda]|uniref:Uncharacterized protein n=1 Tax=Phlyctema vagabunda TaxID=108571 RepID=A0ABR4PEK6_9HELO
MQFINLSTTYKHDETAKKKVRRHVKSEFDRQKSERAAREKLLQEKAQAIMPRFSHMAVDPLNSRFAVGDMDPFRKYPIQMTVQYHRLLRNLYSDSSLIFSTLRNRGFYEGITDPASFTQLLAASSWEMSQDRKSDQTESMKLSVMAIQSLNKRLTGPVIDTSDEMVVALLIFCLYEWIKLDLKAFTVHVDGLSKLVMLRGGLKSLEHNFIVQGLVEKLDKMQALLWGTVPAFPQNKEAFEARARNRCHFLTDVFTIPDTYMTLATGPCFEILEEVKISTNRELERRKILSPSTTTDDEVWASFKDRINAITEDPRLDALQNDLLGICKVGSLLFISRVQQYLEPSRFAHTRVDETYTQEIIALTSASIPIIFIGNAIPIRHPSGPVLMWVLAMSAMGTIAGEQKRWHSVIFAAYRRGLGIWELEDMLALLRRFPWVEEIHTPRLKEIWPLVSTIFAYRG